MLGQKMHLKEKKWDIFISHAFEDKQNFVHPLVVALRSLGVSVWYDDFTLRPGDSLSRSIDKGLAGSTYGLVVVSKYFIKKPWTEYELRGLVAREIEDDKVIIPVWLGVQRREILKFSPPLADKIAIRTEGAKAEDIALQILRTIRPDIYSKHPRAELERIANGQAIRELQKELEHVQEKLAEANEQLSEYLCPYCNSALVARIDAPADPGGDCWADREVYECGYQHFGGHIEQPCPSDPKFPKFEDYELKFENNPEDPHFKWLCWPKPKTDMAMRLSLSPGRGNTKEDAERNVYEKYCKLARGRPLEAIDL